MRKMIETKAHAEAAIFEAHHEAYFAAGGRSEEIKSFWIEPSKLLGDLVFGAKPRIELLPEPKTLYRLMTAPGVFLKFA